jgi:hypothetical protein
LRLGLQLRRAIGGARLGRPRHSRIRRIDSGEWIALVRPRQSGHSRTSTDHTRRINSAHEELRDRGGPRFTRAPSVVCLAVHAARELDDEARPRDRDRGETTVTSVHFPNAE